MSNETIHVIEERDNITDLDMMYGTMLFEEVNDATLLDKCEDEIMVNENEESPLDSDTSTAKDTLEPEKVLDLNDILQQLAGNLDPLHISKFNICRSDIWAGILRECQEIFLPDRKVSVKFTDDLLRKYHPVNFSVERRKVLSLDAKALKEQEYFYAGQLFAMAIVHCGIGPRCLNPVLFDSLVNGPSEIVVPVESVYDLELQVGLQQLISAESVEEANEIIANKKLDSVLELSGSLRSRKSVDDVKDVARETAYWYILGRTRPAFESFRNGLNCLGVLDSILCNPSTFHKVMCFHEQQLSSVVLGNLFSVRKARWNRIDGE
ncbi:G2/M phase-specific E3 ubiquitin-protein ligase-like [Xenia sp. Carnegie-2017]|uniref:G2/M phase-specific E3 ubiquitin-protein ligase-like n=1 Tax=Xenia sp. Carnegie-2017 TaxID=2897299 RepID=UPI001F035088|nr:G2/M phase-specific E3 ubiquitin-protein ligase-like [Xenia sp. Carnegie-2017]